MTPNTVNGKGGLSWPHILWGLGMMMTLLGQWYRMETRMAQLEAAIHLQPSPIIVESRLIKLETVLQSLSDRIDNARRPVVR